MQLAYKISQKAMCIESDNNMKGAFTDWKELLIENVRARQVQWSKWNEWDKDSRTSKHNRIGVTKKVKEAVQG